MFQLRLSRLLAVFLAVPVLQSACVCGPGPNVGGYDDPSGKDPPRSLQGVKFIESEKGEPEVIGCADGQREGFADLTRHKRVAGCLATWEGTKSLRDKPTGKACGDDKGVCTSPADACSKGWHVCGYQGKHEDLKRHTTANACNKEAGPGKFVAAMSHGQTEDLCPPPPTAETVFPCMDSGICSEPVCCGDGCAFGKCRDAIWRGQTKISLGKAEGCGSVTSERNGGVLCCYDGDGDPAAAAGGDTKTDAPPATTDPTAPTGTPPTGAAPTGTPSSAVPPTGAAPTGAANPATGPVDSTRTPSTAAPVDSVAVPTGGPDPTRGPAPKKAGSK
ncbi:hypothetical protein OV203_09310 [Nannocystis sp. ILAH1]|uniref:hypothetical protein n=1 Tax=unclassified Nannocystis TaxID=2627009 RepID=UPI00226ECA18|nr:MULTISPECIES: hypothetical protein [unclassified Nannocystis]MCY0987320.1 hypothetical protein [Nannocystis sp. ILAH1]MCY1070884.1 hypothetical protein [Nannocystis sp. RBIL2]